MFQLNVYKQTVLLQQILLEKNRITVGRSSDNDLVLADPHVSRIEAIFEVQDRTIRLLDKSRNGIMLNGRRVAKDCVVPSGSQLMIFPFTIECILTNDEETRPLPPKPQATSPSCSREREFQKASTPQPVHLGGLVGSSPSMQAVYKAMHEVADSPVTVLIKGEPGTGKELVARGIHEGSHRPPHIFVPVNCAALPLELIESELFGYVKGAFSGAQAPKAGKIEEAERGTLFLDEVGDLPAPAQAKLLRFLQQKAIMRLGSSKETPVDVRIVTATNRNLEAAIKNNSFREDLYYRIRVVEITVPPLRDRSEDIPSLVSHLSQKISQELHLSQAPVFTEGALEQLVNYSWPGNVRQLENMIYGAILRSKPHYCVDEAILESDRSFTRDPGQPFPPASLNALNQQALLSVLEKHRWDTGKAAKELGVSRGTVYYKIKKYGLENRESSTP